MRFRLRKLAFLAGFRRLIAVLLVLAYVATTLGFSWSARVFEPGAASYPCQAHQCGCRSAEQCWTRCCCFTTSQRLSWAVAHHVQPPAEFAGRWRPMRITTMLQPQGTHMLHASIRHPAAHAANDRRRPATGRRSAGKQNGRQPRPHMASSLPNVMEFRPCGSSTARLLRRRFRPPGLSIGPSSTRSRPCAVLCPP